jgi:hypothetical protein
METIILIVAFWLVILGAYCVVILLRDQSSTREATQPAVRERVVFGWPDREEQQLPPAPVRSGRRDESRQVSGLYSEVDLLRAQVERLRSEIVALSGATNAGRDRPRVRRYRTGVYTYLPRMLRRHVREVRSFRRPLRA